MKKTMLTVTALAVGLFAASCGGTDLNSMQKEGAAILDKICVKLQTAADKTASIADGTELAVMLEGTVSNSSVLQDEYYRWLSDKKLGAENEAKLMDLMKTKWDEVDAKNVQLADIIGQLMLKFEGNTEIQNRLEDVSIFLVGGGC